MANCSSLEDLHTHLDTLYDKEKNLNDEKEELLEHSRRSTTSEEKSKIFEAVKTLNEIISLTKQERIRILDLMKIQLEKGRFSFYFNFSRLNYCYFLKKELLLHQLKRCEEVFHHQPRVQNGHLIFFEHMRSISKRSIPSTSYSFKQPQSYLVCALFSKYMSLFDNNSLGVIYRQ